MHNVNLLLVQFILITDCVHKRILIHKNMLLVVLTYLRHLQTPFSQYPPLYRATIQRAAHKA